MNPLVPLVIQLIGLLGLMILRRGGRLPRRRRGWWRTFYHNHDHLYPLQRPARPSYPNMVRAGVVKHPSEWPYGGYREIQSPRQRYALIDYEGLKDILNFKAMDELAEAYRGWIDAAVTKGDLQRDSKWTESIAVGRV